MRGGELLGDDHSGEQDLPGLLAPDPRGLDLDDVARPWYGAQAYESEEDEMKGRAHE